MEFGLTVLPMNGHVIPKRVVHISIDFCELSELRNDGNTKLADAIEEFMIKELREVK